MDWFGQKANILIERGDWERVIEVMDGARMMTLITLIAGFTLGTYSFAQKIPFGGPPDGPDVLISLLPENHQVGDCGTEITPIYKNQNRTDFSGINVTLTHSGKTISFSTTKPLSQRRRSEMVFGIGNVQGADKEKDNPKSRTYVQNPWVNPGGSSIDFISDWSSTPARLIGIKYKMQGETFYCGVHDNKTRIEYEKGLKLPAKDDHVPLFHGTKPGN